MIVAAMLAIELLRFPHLPPCSPRSEPMLCAIQQAGGAVDMGVQATTTYSGAADWLVFWGPGHPSRIAPMQAQLAKGGHVLAFDLGYWNRETKVRLSIDGAHPQQWVMRRTWPVDRLVRDRIPIADVWDPNGPILIAGVGPKAHVQYGDQVARWEGEMLAACGRFGRPIHYRPKHARYPSPPGVIRRDDGSIDQTLVGTSLLVTWHSNAAVDAIRMGIPVICRDGAAAAVCASALPTVGHLQPLTQDVRDRFLANLAWFQWAPDEASTMLGWVRDVLA